METDARDPRASDAVRSRDQQRPGLGGAYALYVASFFSYLNVGIWLNFHYGYIDVDNQGRVAAASFVIFSRFPHLAAMGFVWNPLPSTVELPLLLAKALWPSLLSRSLAGIVMSSLFMAGAVVEVRGILTDRGARRIWLWVIVAAFALHPMIVLYGATGMSEAPYIFFTLWAVRRLIRWLHSGTAGDLVIAGFAIGLDYMTRYEALAIGGAGALFVLVMTWVKSRNSRAGPPAPRAILEAGIFVFPVGVAFAFWSAASWVISGSAFAQFSSRYGNSSSVLLADNLITNSNRFAHGAWLLVVRNAVALEVLLPLIVVLASATAVRRHDPDVLPPLVLFGAGLTFSAIAYAAGLLYPWLRFSILSIPLAVVLVAFLVPKQAGCRLAVEATGAVGPQKLPPAFMRLRAVVAIAMLLIALPIAWKAMLDPRIGIQESWLRSVSDPRSYPPDQNAYLTAWNSDASLASMLDSMRLPRASVLIDTFNGSGVVVRSTHPGQFVITSDYDFLRDLNDPGGNGIRYIVDYSPNGPAQAVYNAVNVRYPSMWSDRSPVASLTFSVGTGADQIRVFRVNTPHTVGGQLASGPVNAHQHRHRRHVGGGDAINAR